MKISERDLSSSFKTYKLFDDCLILTFNALGWLISFWLKPAYKEPPYIAGGFGIWRVSLRIHFDFLWDIEDEN